MGKVWIIGQCPPPLGGVTVFNYRYANLLRKMDFPVEIIDLNAMPLSTRLANLVRLMGARRSLIHFSVLPGRGLLTAILLSPFHPHVAFLDHGWSRAFTGMSSRELVARRLFFRRVDRCILVNEHLRANYAEARIPLPSGTIVRNAFLPPPLEDEGRIRSTYSAETLRFVSSRRPLIIANAFKLVFYNGVDLYGLDMCVELALQLKGRFANLGLLFALASVGDPQYFAALRERIRNLNLESYFHFLCDQKELWPLFRSADLMVRPTCVDAYGVSIREALYFGCPAVASDVCTRPKGTTVFPNRDTNAFVSACVKELESGHSSRDRLCSDPQA